MRGRTEEPRPRRHNPRVGIMEQPVEDVVVGVGHGCLLSGGNSTFALRKAMKLS